MNQPSKLVPCVHVTQKPWQPEFLQKKQATAHLLVHVCAWQPRYVPKDGVTAPTLSGPSSPTPSPSGNREYWHGGCHEEQVGGQGGPPDLGEAGMTGVAWHWGLSHLCLTPPHHHHHCGSETVSGPSSEPDLILWTHSRQPAPQGTFSILETICTDPGPLRHHHGGLRGAVY